MNISKKVLALLVIIAIAITAIAMAALFVPAVGAWFTATFGGAGVGFLNLMQMPLQWALVGGAQTIVLYGVGLAVMFLFAYWVWHWDIGYKLTGASGGTAPGNYQSAPSQNIIPIDNAQSQPSNNNK